MPDETLKTDRITMMLEAGELPEGHGFTSDEAAAVAYGLAQFFTPLDSLRAAALFIMRPMAGAPPEVIEQFIQEAERAAEFMRDADQSTIGAVLIMARALTLSGHEMMDAAMKENPAPDGLSFSPPGVVQ